MKKLVTLVLMVGALAVVSGCSESNDPVAPATADADKGRLLTENSIVDVALAVNADSGEFSTLIAALVAADLVEALQQRGQFTVFAPTDEAFAALDLDATNVGDLPVDQLTDILLYHVARGKREAADVVASDRIRMLNGEFAFVEVTGEGAFIDGALIVDTDVPAANGVIHVIGAVMLP
ncbi:MAG: fasciclin domain-containing protein [Candidatus Krumholzibacteriia bacterium]